jgi:hypothetical protein
MSCITEILRVKGDKEFIVDGKIAIEGGGIYKEYEYLITFTSHGHRCGYVAISADHPTYSDKNEYPDFDVHGGITFFEDARFEKLTGGHKCTDKWLGFDAGHSCDISDYETAAKYFGETEFNKFMKNEDKKFGDWKDENSRNRSYSYMENECKNLIDQLIEIRKAA